MAVTDPYPWWSLSAQIELVVADYQSNRLIVQHSQALSEVLEIFTMKFHTLIICVPIDSVIINVPEINIQSFRYVALFQRKHHKMPWVSLYMACTGEDFTGHPTTTTLSNLAFGRETEKNIFQTYCSCSQSSLSFWSSVILCLFFESKNTTCCRFLEWKQ